VGATIALELIGVAEALEGLRDQREHLRDGVAADERLDGHGAVEDDVGASRFAHGVDVPASDRGAEGGGRFSRAGPVRARRERRRTLLDRAEPLS
jgi:hypothetical protein